MESWFGNCNESECKNQTTRARTYDETEVKLSPGRYQQLDLFIKVLRLLCPNLTDASAKGSQAMANCYLAAWKPSWAEADVC